MIDGIKALGGVALLLVGVPLLAGTYVFVLTLVAG